MAAGSVKIADKLGRADGDTRPIADADMIRGCIQTVANDAARDAIPADVRVTGMLAVVLSSASNYGEFTVYRLTSAPSILPGTWSSTGIGSGGSASRFIEVSTSVTLDDVDTVIIAHTAASSNPITLSLPAATTLGRKYEVLDADGFGASRPVRFDAGSGGAINGQRYAATSTGFEVLGVEATSATGVPWVITTLRGAAGVQGPQGQQGPPGPQGIQGPQGDPGAAGASGMNPFTSTTQQFTVPNAGETIAIRVVESRWAHVGQEVSIEGAGTFKVSSISSNIVLWAYAPTADWLTGSPGAVISPGAAVSPGGAIGPRGIPGTTGATGPAPSGHAGNPVVCDGIGGVTASGNDIVFPNTGNATITIEGGGDPCELIIAPNHSDGGITAPARLRADDVVLEVAGVAPGGALWVLVRGSQALKWDFSGAAFSTAVSATSATVGPSGLHARVGTNPDYFAVSSSGLTSNVTSVFNGPNGGTAAAFNNPVTFAGQVTLSNVPLVVNNNLGAPVFVVTGGGAQVDVDTTFTQHLVSTGTSTFGGLLDSTSQLRTSGIRVGMVPSYVWDAMGTTSRCYTVSTDVAVRVPSDSSTTGLVRDCNGDSSWTVPTGSAWRFLLELTLLDPTAWASGAAICFSYETIAVATDANTLSVRSRLPHPVMPATNNAVNIDSVYFEVLTVGRAISFEVHSPSCQAVGGGKLHITRVA